jgi:hypothetical protein
MGQIALMGDDSKAVSLFSNHDGSLLLVEEAGGVPDLGNLT